MTARHCRRQILSVLALGIAATASIATSPLPPKAIVGDPVAGSFVVDRDHVVVSQRIVVSVSDAAMTGRGGVEVSFAAASDGGAGVGIVVVPGSGESAAYQGTGTGGAVDLGPSGGATFDFTCVSGCERTYRIVATWRGSGTHTVTWQATEAVMYSGNWPAGASITASADAPIAQSGEGRTLSANLADQRIDVDATHPAAARVIEIRLAASAVARPGDSLITTARLDPVVSNAKPASGSSGAGGPAASVRLTPLATASAYAPRDVQPQFDPFEDCPAGQDCVRRYLLAASWSGPQPAAIEWALDVLQLRVRGAPAAPDALQVRVVGSYEISPAAPKRLHFEGDLSVAPRDGDRWRQATLPVSVVAPSDPVGSSLPVPVVAHVRAGPKEGAAAAGASIDVFPQPPGTAYEQTELARDWDPFGFWQANTGGPLSLQVTVAIGAGATASPAPQPVTFHWSLDLDVFAYTDVPAFTVTSSGPTVRASPGP